MTQLVPDDSLLRFAAKIFLAFSKRVIFHLGQVLPSNELFTSDGVSFEDFSLKLNGCVVTSVIFFQADRFHPGPGVFRRHHRPDLLAAVRQLPLLRQLQHEPLHDAHRCAC